jgi:hypothetical protein
VLAAVASGAFVTVTAPIATPLLRRRALNVPNLAGTGWIAEVDLT